MVIEPPSKEDVQRANAAMARMKVPRFGALRINRGVFVALVNGVEVGDIYDAELRVLGQNVHSLLRGKNESELVEMRKRLAVVLEKAHKKIQKQGVYAGLAQLMLHTDTEASFNKAGRPSFGERLRERLKQGLIRFRRRP